MDIHNISEDRVFNTVQNIFDEIQNGGNPEGYCLCYQCKIDTICFTLNRVEPHYIVSNRGLTRLDQICVNSQQNDVDIASLVYKGLRLVNHNMRPTAPHDSNQNPTHKSNNPLFDIPTIAGRIFNGESFEPVTDIEVGLYCDGELVPMRNSNWQNPYTMVPSTPGAFGFWPAPVIAETADINQSFKYSVKVHSADYEPLIHFFDITAISKYHSSHSQSLNRTFKLPDLYVFPPGEAEQNG